MVPEHRDSIQSTASLEEGGDEEQHTAFGVQCMQKQSWKKPTGDILLSPRACHWHTVCRFSLQHDFVIAERGPSSTGFHAKTHHMWFELTEIFHCIQSHLLPDSKSIDLSCSSEMSSPRWSQTRVSSYLISSVPGDQSQIWREKDAVTRNVMFEFHPSSCLSVHQSIEVLASHHPRLSRRRTLHDNP